MPESFDFNIVKTVGGQPCVPSRKKVVAFLSSRHGFECHKAMLKYRKYGELTYY
jgi:hypothetical protein